MKASELIELLQKGLMQHGDHEICTSHDDCVKYLTLYSTRYGTYYLIGDYIYENMEGFKVYEQIHLERESHEGEALDKDQRS